MIHVPICPQHTIGLVSPQFGKSLLCVCVCACVCVRAEDRSLLQNIVSFTKETYNLKKPTNRSHPILETEMLQGT